MLSAIRLDGRSVGGDLGAHGRDLVCEVARRRRRHAAASIVFKAHRLVYHSTLGLRVIKKKKTLPQKHRLSLGEPGIFFAPWLRENLY